MLFRTIDQVWRFFKILAAFTLLLIGAVMLVTPGPGLLVIFVGLTLLAAEFVWARRLMNHIKRQGDLLKEQGNRLKDSVWRLGKSDPV